MSRPVPMRDTDVDEALKRIIDKQKIKMGYEVIDPIATALELLKNIYAGLILLPGVPAFTIRIETLRTLLDSFMEQTQRPYEERLREAGFLVGDSFSQDFIRSLEEIEMIPTDYPQTVRLWLQIERNANWGDFLFKKGENEFSISATNTFLTRNLENEVHRHCEFISGYFDGFLWGVLPMIPRLFRETFDMPSGQAAVRVDSVEHRNAGSQCFFEVALKSESLVDAIDRCFNASSALKERSYVKFATEIRAGIESALKVTVGRHPSDRTNFSPIIRAYKDREILESNLINRVKDDYGKTSGVIHSGNKITELECQHLLRDVRALVRVLELGKLSQAQRESLNKLIEEYKTTRPADQKPEG